jgi:phage baseplate assembly protein W
MALTASTLYNNPNTQHWAYDISKNVITKGEIHDKDVINQSVEAVILTMFHERVFNHTVGSVAGTTPFTILNETSGEAFLDSVIESIKKWEDRIVVLSQQATLKILNDQSACIIGIPYVIKASGVPSKYEKKLIF